MNHFSCSLTVNYTVMLQTCEREEIPDGVVVKLEQVGQFVKEDGTWLCHDHLFNPNLQDRSTTCYTVHVHSTQLCVCVCLYVL